MNNYVFGNSEKKNNNKNNLFRVDLSGPPENFSASRGAKFVNFVSSLMERRGKAFGVSSSSRFVVIVEKFCKNWGAHEKQKGTQKALLSLTCVERGGQWLRAGARVLISSSELEILVATFLANSPNFAPTELSGEN